MDAQNRNIQEKFPFAKFSLTRAQLNIIGILLLFIKFPCLYHTHQLTDDNLARSLLKWRHRDIFLNRDLKNKEFDSCVYEENDSFAKQFNEELIEHFETTLSSFEKNPICT